MESALDTAPLEAALGEIPEDLAFAAAIAAAAERIQQRVIDIWRVMSSVRRRAARSCSSKCSVS